MQKVSTKRDAKKIKDYQISKKKSWAFDKFSGHNHALLINKYQWNSDVIMSKYVT